MDYRKTLNLPDNIFPIKVKSSELERKILDFWKKQSIYKKRQELNANGPGYLLYNQPIPAYGHVSIREAVNVILRDIVVKYKLMLGFDVPNYPGWNCYDPNIELEALKFLKKENNVSEQAICRQCRKIASEYISIQKKQLQRLGIFAYWDHPILTSGFRSKLKTIETFGELYNLGYLQKDLRMTHWCIECQTDLDKNEVEYKEYDLLSLMVKFPVINGLEEMGENVYLVVMTNTPWTLSSNTTIMIHPNREYVAIKSNNEVLIMSENAGENFLNEENLENCNIIRRFKGLELGKTLYAHPLTDKYSEILLDKRISLSKGTGCIHGTLKPTKSNYASERQRIHSIIPIIDQYGCLTDEAGQFCGINVFDSSQLISMELEKRNCLLSSKNIKELYPHCLHCKNPVIIKSDDKWFINLGSSDSRQNIIKAINKVDWFPYKSNNTFVNSFANKLEWDISRRRTWGIPFPVFYCNKCNTQLSILESVKASIDAINKNGFNWWLTAKPEKIIPEEILCSRCGGRDFQQESGTFDPEFVSAISYKLLLSSHKSNLPYIDTYLRGYSNSGKCLQFSILSSISTDGLSPFRSIFAHYGILNRNGNKILKKLDGEISLENILDSFGADIFRLWSVSMDSTKELTLSKEQLDSVSKGYMRIRNTCRFLLNNLTGYDQENDRLNYEYLKEIDRWILHRLARLVRDVNKAIDNCQFHTMYRLIYNFCCLDLSSLYLNVVKRRLYVLPRWSSSRRAVQTAIYEILVNLAKLISPFLTFTAEDIWHNIPGITDRCNSIYMSNWPDLSKNLLDPKLEERWNILLKIRSQIYKYLEKIRNEEEVKNSSQAYVTLYTSNQGIYELLESYIDELEIIFKISKVRIMPPGTSMPDGIWESHEIKGLAIEGKKATGEKCERCRIYSDTVGTNEQYPTLCYNCIGILEGGMYYI